MKLALKKHWPFILISILFFLFYSLFSLVEHYLFRTNAYDLGIFNQTLYHYAHFDLGPNTLRNVPTLLADHFELIMFFFAPFYWLFGSYTLLVIQIAAIHFGALGIYLLIEHQSKDKWLSLGATFLFYISFGVINALSYDFHNNVVGIMFLPWLIYWLSLKKMKAYYLFLGLFLISKENLPLIGAFLGLSIILFEKKELKKHGLITLLVSSTYFIVVLKGIIPALNSGGYDHWAYTSLGSGPLEAIGTMIRQPFKTIQLLFDDEIKQDTWRLIWMSGGILLIFKPKYLLLAIPVIAQKFFSNLPVHWGHAFQYSIELAPIIVLGAASSLAFLKNKLLRYGLMGVLILLNLYLYRGMDFYDKTQLKDYFTLDRYQLNFDRKDLMTAIDLIPKKASVSAQNTIVPHVANRDQIIVVSRGKDERFTTISAASSDYIILNLNDSNTWPIENTEALIQKKEEIESRPNYDLIYESGGVFLYQKQ